MTKPRHSEPPQPMLTALGLLAVDGATKSAAYGFLKTNLSRLDSEEDLKRAYHGLMCAQQCLGPLHPGYQKSLIEMRRTLDHFAEKFEDSAPGDSAPDCEECGEAQWDFWQSVLKLINPHLPEKI